LETRVRALGANHPDVANSLNNLGVLYERQEKYAQAEDYYSRALKIYERGSEHPRMANCMTNLGMVLSRQRQHQRAEHQLARALEMSERLLGAGHPNVARSLVGLAGNAIAQHQLDTAREHAERAVSICESSEASPDLLAHARFVLAQALWPDHVQRPRARTLAEQARNAYAELGESHRHELAQVEAWLEAHAASATR
jgi:tetratricopeptide (TPR) repeat protein